MMAMPTAGTLFSASHAAAEKRRTAAGAITSAYTTRHGEGCELSLALRQSRHRQIERVERRAQVLHRLRERHALSTIAVAHVHRFGDAADADRFDGRRWIDRLHDRALAV